MVGSSGNPAAAVANGGEGRPLEAGGALVGETRVVRELRARVAALARVGSTVLICGEIGTGKTAVARALHAASARRAGPFVHVDCAGLVPGLAAGSLFADEGARGLRDGPWPRHFEAAAGGALFLDEIGDLEPAAQPSLRHALEQGHPGWPGRAEAHPSDVRMIASTSEDPAVLVESGRLRVELYFRLNVIRLELPPLREHLADLPLLVADRLRRLSGSLGVPAPRVHESFYERLLAHPWPGNARELANVLERACVQSAGAPLTADLIDGLLDGGMPRRRPAAGEAPVAEAGRIASVLRATGGNVSRAARRLGIARSTLRYRIRLHDLGHLIPED